MNFIRARGIPLWVTAFFILAGVMGTVIGFPALFDPSAARGYVDGAEALGVSWGGRNTGLGIAMIVAVLLRSPGAYAAAVSGAIFREFSDILVALPDGGGTVIGLGVFVAIEIVCLIICLRAALNTNAPAST